MQIIGQNPVITLRAQVASLSLAGFLRWDTSGRALLASDAPKHMPEPALRALMNAHSFHYDINLNMLYIDLQDSAYEAITRQTFFVPGPFVEGYYEAQALLSLLLTRAPVSRAPCPVDKPLLRSAMLACAQGEAKAYAFLRGLAAHDAVALRQGNTLSIRACAALCAHFLYTEKGIGLPSQYPVLLPGDMA